MKECTVCSTCFSDNLDSCPSDRAPLKHSLRCDLILDERYKLERRLGRGGMGVVFKASHVFLRSTHAVKVILPDLAGEDAMLVTRFRQEAVVAASIRHKNIVSVTDFGVAEGTMPFLVMELLVGKSLWEMLTERGRLSARESLEIMEAIGAGVSAAHRQGVVHRDLKPLNIFLQEGMPINEGLKILDFGLAKIKSTDLYGSLVQAQTTNLMGSPLYMAPEQWSEGEPDARADLYSMGVILYQMLAGDTPFSGSSMPKIMKGHLLSEPPSFASAGVRVSRQVEDVVRHALEKDPHNRPSSVEELLAELRRAVSNEDAVSNPLMITLSSEIETPLPPISGEGLTRKFGPASSAEPLEVDDHTLIEAQQQIDDEADRLMRELKDAQRRAEDARKRVEEAARKRAEKDAERKRAEEAAARKRAEEEQALKRAQEEEQKRAAAEQVRKRAEEEESQRLAAEEAQRGLEQEHARKLAADEANRLSMEVADARSRAEEARKRAEEEAKGRAQEEAARREAEERAAKLAQELEAVQQRAEEARKRAEEQELRRAEEDAERRLAEEESERKRAEEEERRREEEEKARKVAEAEAARLAAEVKEAQQRVEEARIRAEEEAQRRLEEEAARMRAEEEAVRLIHEVDEVKHRADEVRKLAEAEAVRLGREVDEAKRENEVRKLAEEEARKEVAKELERKYWEQRERDASTAEEITIVQGRASSDIVPEKSAQAALRTQPREFLPVAVDSYQRRSLIKWVAPVVLVALLGFAVYAAYQFTRVAPPPPAEAPAIRPDLVSIPSGTFTMGRDDGRPQEGPAHSATVKAFSIDRTEVTNAEYAAFVHATNHAPPSYWVGSKPPAQLERLPVVDISYQDAEAFAAWRSKRDGVTYRLPTEEEWEYAARGVNGYLYPWGKTWVDNYANVNSDSPKAVGSYPEGASSWGALDMVGNVIEWTSSRASIYPGNKEMRIDADKKDWIVVRGSSYMARDPLDMATTMRQSLPASNKHPFVGFRLVRDGS